MANAILTPTEVTREVLRVLHQKANFIGSVNRQYDDRYAQSEAKIGTDLKIRLPNQYVVRTGKTLNAQDTSESSVTLTMATQKGVDMNFSSAELTMQLQDFSKRIIEPAATTLIANIEADALQSMTKDIYQLAGTPGTTPASLLVFGTARQYLNQALALKGDRTALVDSATSASMVDALKGLFQDSTQIKEQYREGMIGRTGGFDFMENESILNLTAGSNTRSSGPVLNGAPANGAATLTLATAGNSKTINKGDVFTIAGVYSVHPETKQAYGTLQQFVVTANTDTTGGGAATLPVSPALYSSGALQNISIAPVGTEALTFVGTLSTSYGQDLVYHRDAFAFVTADLQNPAEMGCWGARETFDGVSVRIVRQYDITNDNWPCRLDVLYGFKTLRPQLACRVTK